MLAFECRQDQKCSSSMTKSVFQIYPLWPSSLPIVARHLKQGKRRRIKVAGEKEGRGKKVCLSRHKQDHHYFA